MRQASFWRSLLVLFLAVTCMRVWLGPLPFESTAAAQLVNPTAQRREQLEELRQSALVMEQMKTSLESIAAGVDDIRALLRQGVVRVRMESAQQGR